jgi:hypothetical protein
MKRPVIPQPRPSRPASNFGWTFPLLIVELILSAVVFCALGACTDETTARRALDAAGFSDIQITGYGLFDCSKDDQLHTRFAATGPTGKRVSGVVCSGLMKGSTIRFD